MSYKFDTHTTPGGCIIFEADRIESERRVARVYDMLFEKITKKLMEEKKGNRT